MDFCNTVSYLPDSESGSLGVAIGVTVLVLVLIVVVGMIVRRRTCRPKKEADVDLPDMEKTRYELLNSRWCFFLYDWNCMHKIDKKFPFQLHFANYI